MRNADNRRETAAGAAECLARMGRPQGRRKHFRGFSGPLAFAVLGLWRMVAVLALLFAALVENAGGATLAERS